LKPDRTADSTANCFFSSAHATVCHMAFCDGSAHPVSYGVEPAIHARLGSRSDGVIVNRLTIVD